MDQRIKKLETEINDLKNLIHRNTALFQIQLNFLSDIMCKHGITFSRAELEEALKEV